MAHIAVDVDSTLYDFEAPAREAFFTLAEERGDKTLFRGLYMPWPEWRSPGDVHGLDLWLEVIDRVHEPQAILSREPLPGAEATLWNLVSQGHELVYVTSRKGECHEATFEWIHRYFPEGEVICSSHDKAEHLTSCQYLIDDRPKTLVEFVYDFDWKSKTDLPRVAFGPMYEYNRALTDIPNIYLAPTWQGIRYYLQREGILKELVHA